MTDILDDLRTATRSDHEAVEALVALDRPGFALVDYRHFLEIMLRAHEPFEAACSEVPELAVWLPDLATRAKTAQLRADLRRLGATPAAEAPLAPLDLGTALGGLYVLEGSTLGARFVLASLQERLGSEVDGAITYLEGYGQSRAQRWQELCAVLRRAATDDALRAAILEGAQRTFARVRALFAQASAKVDDAARLAALEDTGLLDALPQASLDRFTRIAALALDAPVALVSLVDHRRQFFSSLSGLPEPWATTRETPLSHSFCKHVVETGAELVVTDAPTDPRVAGNGAIVDLGVIAYAGKPIRTADGHVLGSFCVIDSKPRDWTSRQLEILGELRDAVVTEIELRRTALGFERSELALASSNREMQISIEATSRASEQVVHDVRSPLNVIQLGAQLLLKHEAMQSFPELARMVERIVRNAQHASSLLQGISIPPPGGHADLVAVATQVTSDQVKGGPRIELDVTGAPVSVPLADTALRRCVENVVGNALRFARERVRVSVQCAGDGARLVVEDDGPGLPDAEAYLSAWQRGVRHHEGKGSGSGLGLAIVRELVEAAGGGVEAGASSLGGARFALRLPVTP